MAFVATVPIAMWTLDAIRAWVPIRMYGAADIAFDARAVAASAAFSLSYGAAVQRRTAVVGARPIRRWTRFAARPRRPPTRAGGGSAAAWPWQKSHLALVLLAGAVTVIRTVASLMAVDLGVRADRVLVIGVDWPSDQAQADRRVPLAPAIRPGVPRPSRRRIRRRHDWRPGVACQRHSPPS